MKRQNNEPGLNRGISPVEDLAESDASKRNLSFPAAHAPKTRSISRTLTLLLTGAVLLASLITVVIIYVVISQKGGAQLDEKTNDTLLSLSDILEIPLWNLDARVIEKIATAFVSDELFEKLRITDSMKTVYFDFTRSRNAAVVTKSVDIRHDGQIIGHVDVAFTTEFISKQNHQVLLSGLGILLVVVFALVSATGISFRVLLNKLFYRLDVIADAYASGSYDAVRYQAPFVESYPLIRILGDMRDRLNAQIQEIQLAEIKYRSIFENAVEGIYQSLPEGRFVSANPAMSRMLGYESPEELIREVESIGRQLYVVPERREEYIRELRMGKQVADFQVQFYTRDRKTVWVSLHARPVLDAKGELRLIEGMAVDITQQKERETAHRQLEQQLHDVQRLESVGRLAGGVAHDFNNMLGIILGCSDLILETLSVDDLNYEMLKEINSAAKRSADLTRQLLAFARKQTVSPRILNVNQTVGGMLKMLQRLIGEDIDLSWIPGDDLPPIYIDPSQLDQILANLCINARDAISGVGKIMIETATVVLDEKYCRCHLDVLPGKYVLLAVTDNGYGMEQSVIENIFEPFFTTKDMGKGTGLGLATIYGIVKQNKGSIDVYSKVGQGTTFNLYFPANDQTDEDSPVKTDGEFAPGEGETVLVVEDEKSLLALTKRILEQLGYAVLAANSPIEAIQIARAHPGGIQLLMTDVVMPEMNGRDLADRLTVYFPGLKCLFMSGYTADVIAHQGCLDGGIHFIPKPFTKRALAVKLRDVLRG